MKRPNYEIDNDTFSAEAYRVRHYPGVAFYVYGWETEPDEDTEWSGIEVRTGRIVAIMVGDDRRFSFDPDDAEPLPREEYCGSCGQIGCAHDGLDRSESA
jgi:hypothetical protein